ncbi:hypothetical protein DV711_18625 [Motiliproteus coralliicola]|uniref:Uncharacterized protein n=1 Tax=Motiliproteus coralliicola TaxID=2283196 RepID=A0A369WBX6_9GAMM|nr:hypothetical protein [Motiliproteus coralliicola]RDE18126.1 hypothetical protein DV711_18625 [Motiliproteus coralliicola]
MLNKLFGRNRLARAIADNDLPLLLKAIRAGEPLDQPFILNEQETTALQHCLSLSRTELLAKLLEAGISLPDNNLEQAALLTQAIESGPAALELSTLLLQSGIDPNAADGQVLFDLLELQDSNRLNLLLNRFLQYGAEFNRHQRNGQSLLTQLLQQSRPLAELQLLSGMLIQAGAQLPEQLDRLDCSDDIKAFARRQAEDVAIRQRLSGSPLG